MSSRRKQSRPKHLDSDLNPLDASITKSLAENGSTFCEKCRRSFITIEDYVTHRTACLLSDEMYTENSDVKGSVVSDLNPHRDDDMDSVGEDGASEDGGSEHSDEEDNQPTAMSKSTDDEDSDKFDKIPSKIDDFKGEYPLSYSPNDNNVTLEPLANTRAAVAQFADTPAPGQDVNVLQATLYNLQQQQIVQLQLIQHLQHQLMRGGQANTKQIQSILPALNAVNLSSLAPQLYPLSLALHNNMHNLNTLNAKTNTKTNTSMDLSTSRTSDSRSSGSNDEDEPSSNVNSLNTSHDQPKSSPVEDTSDMGDDQFKCDICQTYFPNQTTLTIHYARHKDETPDKHRPDQHRPDIPIPMRTYPSTCMTNTNPLLTNSVTEFNNQLARADTEKEDVGLDLAKHRGLDLTPRSTTYLDPSMSALPSTSTNSPLTSMAQLVASDKTNVNALLSSMTPPMIPNPHSHPQPPMSFLSPNSIPGPFPPTSDSPYNDSMLPQGKTIEPSENLEQYMECTKSETSKLEQLVKSIERKMNDPNQCIICHRVLSCKSALQMHYRIHTGERPFRCKICGRSFTTKGNLKTHMGVHRSKPPLRIMHQCPVCHKQFTNLLVLQQHIRMHTSPVTDAPPNFNFHHPQPWLQRPYPESNFLYPQSSELDLSRKPNHESLPMAPGGELDLSLSATSADLSLMRHNGHHEERMDQDSDDGADNDSVPDENTQNNNYMDDEQEEQRGIKRPRSDESPDRRSRSPSPANNRPISPSLNNNENPERSAYTTSLEALEAKVNAIDTAPSYSERFYESFGGENKSDRASVSSSESGSGEETPINTDMKPSVLFPTGIPDIKTMPFHGFPFYGHDMPPMGFPGGDDSVTICNVCYKTFACRSALDIHYRSHTKERPFKCEVCDRFFTTRGNMRQHMLTHKIRDLPSGPTDNEHVEPNNEDTNTNTDNHQEEYESQTVKEEIAPVAEQDIPEIKIERFHERHNSSENPESKPLPPNAPISTTSDEQSPFIRRSGPKHQCQVCQKHFSSASALQIHIRTHTGDKPFKCTVCSKAFTTKGNLKVHMGTHMWNNSPSRRGRRMSIEPMFPYGQKTENPYLAAAAAAAAYTPRPDFFFPYPQSPYMNGLGQKMNEVSVIQSLNGSLPRFPQHYPNGLTPLPPSFAPGFLPPNFPVKRGDQLSTSASSDSDDAKPKYASSGELDLSMKPAPSSSPDNDTRKEDHYNRSPSKSPQPLNLVPKHSPSLERSPSSAGSKHSPSTKHSPPTLTKSSPSILPHQSPYLAAAPWYWKGPYSSVLNGSLDYTTQQKNASVDYTSHQKSRSLDYTTPHKSSQNSDRKDEDENENKTSFTGGYVGELNLSLKAMTSPSPITSPPRKRHDTSPSPAKSPRIMSSPSHSSPHLPTPWLWKSSCHMCSFVCGSPTALDLHMRTHHFREDASQSQGVVA